MSIEIEFVGAARTVTGSKHLIRTSKATVLLDCGLFQGRREEALRKNKTLDLDFEDIDAVVLSHAHIDHSGALPLLYKKGYRGPVYMTFATRDLCMPMLRDTAFILKSDAEHLDRLIAKGEKEIKKVEPLYEESDVEGVSALFQGIAYRQPQEIAPGVTLTFLDAGHVLGSSVCVLDVEDQGRHKRIAFTGDLGRKHIPILKKPEVPENVNVLITESTYGDRLHNPIDETEEQLAQIIQETVARGGKVLIPSFALERAQEIVYTLKKLLKQKRLKPIPVYVDSPLAVHLTDVFKQHLECCDPNEIKAWQEDDSPFDFKGLFYVSTVEESKDIDRDPAPAIIIAASGMCEGGRVLHHLIPIIGDAKNTILIVGFQAEHTLGRKLVEKRAQVRIFGIPYVRKAEVKVLNGFSAHADQQGLLDFAEAVKDKGALEHVVLVHGEPKSQEALANQLMRRGFPQVHIPASGGKLENI